MKTLAHTVVLFMLTVLVASAGEAGKQVEKSLKISDSVSVPYLQYLPKDFDASDKDKKYPLMLFLHGRGESNGPLSMVKKWGPPKLVDKGKDLPCILISPQCPKEDWWSSPAQTDRLLALLDHVRKEFPVDESRILLTGLSMGGYGSWELAARRPDLFAAVMPICGGGKPENASKLVDIPIWVFHGTADEAVPFQLSVDMVEAIRKAGGKNIRFTRLDGVGHNSWSTAYGDKEVWEWFAAQQKKK